MSKYYVDFVKKGYATLDEARASAFRIMDKKGSVLIGITDADGMPVGYVEYSKDGYKPYWKKAGNKRAYHIVEHDGSIRKR